MVSIAETQLLLKIRSTTNDSHLVQLSVVVFCFADLSPGQQLPRIKEAVADPLQKYI